MIRHIVLTQFEPRTSEAQISAIYEDLSNLVTALPGAHGFVGGRSQSPEQIERGYMHGFTIDFDDWASLARYAENEDHKALGARLVANSVGGKDGLLVVDIEV